MPTIFAEKVKNLKFGPISNSPVVFLVYICLFSLKTKDYATK
jgi:hypothetical protein